MGKTQEKLCRQLAIWGTKTIFQMKEEGDDEGCG